MKKILLLGENDSIWTKKCIEHSEITGKYDIYALTQGRSKNDAFYNENGIKICNLKRHTLFRNIPKVRGLIFRFDYINYIRSLKKKTGNFDVVHISYVIQEKMMAVRYLRKTSKKIVVTFWGSDLLRVSDKKLAKYRKALGAADVIMLSTHEMRNRFASVFGNEFDDKIIGLKFGCEGLEHIDPENKGEARKLFSVPEGKTVVTVGYNGLECQNHIKVAETLKKLDKAQRDRLFILLPVTYSLTAEYKNRLTSSFDALGCGYKMIDSFLDEDEVGKLRESTDVFIHAQTTDAFSSSVQEYLYGRKLVFNPEWIRYKEMKDKGIYYKEYHDYDELRQMLSDYLENGLTDEEQQKLDQNSRKIWELSSWGSVSEQWNSLYRVDD